MGKVKDGGPAFSAVNGISLRDYFAAAALQGLMAYTGGVTEDGNATKRYAAARAAIAEEAYLMADAMLAEREKGNAR